MKAFYMFIDQFIFEFDLEDHIPKTKPYPLNFAVKSRHTY